MSRIGIIIQARMDSTRLPGKMILPFYAELTLLDVVLKKVEEFSAIYPIILATSIRQKDDIIESYANKYNMTCYRGDELDVLKRFIIAAEKNGIDTVVRVCADNPFLSSKLIMDLLTVSKKNKFDYISYQNSEGIPTIRTHYGFFAEIVTLSALKKVSELTEHNLYHEHVTNFIYTNCDLFKIKLLKIPFEENNKVRLTIDTQEDFNLAKIIYSDLMNTKLNVEPETVMNYLSKNLNYLDLMNQQIKLQTK